ncbi:MAG: CPBP family intramembrane metalloprotease [Chloroflexi bacterium]|nr:CPBP family intramembrane metalloprotease [Chloroflexota bacterium]
MENSKRMLAKATEFFKRVRYKKLTLPRIFNPIVSFKSLLLSFIFLQIGGLASIHFLNLLTGKPLYSPQPLQALVGTMTITAVSGLVEELFFRGIFKWFSGEIGLVVGTVIWIVLHQFKFATPIATPKILFGDTLFGIFYFKLWRGNWWWVAIIIHILWNPAVILLKNTYGLG